MTSLSAHPQRNSVRLQLRQNPLLQGISNAQWSELEPLLLVADYRKGDPLVRQGDEEMEQFFIVEGMLKRVVSNPEGREMILRFAAENEMDTSYAAWRLRTPVPYSIVAVTKVRTVELPMPVWAEYPREAPRAQGALRARGDEADVGGDGAHHHAAPARRARPPVALPAQAPGARRAASRKRSWRPTSTSRPKRLSRLKQKLG